MTMLLMSSVMPFRSVQSPDGISIVLAPYVNVVVYETNSPEVGSLSKTSFMVNGYVESIVLPDP